MKKQLNPIFLLIFGILFFVVGILLIFSSNNGIKETLNCNSSGNCSYILQNIKNEVVKSDNFMINDVFEVRKDIVKKDEYDRICYDSRIGSEYKKYKKHNKHLRHNDKKLTTVYFNDVYIKDEYGNVKCILINTSAMFNKFKKYYELRKNNAIPADSQLYFSRIDIFSILGCLFISLMGLFSVCLFFKNGKK